MKTYPISIRPYGTHAVLVEWPRKVDEAILDDILLFNNFLKTNCIDPNIWETVPAYNSLILVQRSGTITLETFKNQLLE